MRTRSDYTLRLLIEKVMELGTSEHVGQVLQDALRHMGGRSPYRGGKELLSLLRHAEKAAREAGDSLSSERIEDALAYAMNVMLGPDVLVKYQLFPNSRLTELTFIRNTFDQLGKEVLRTVRSSLADNPSLTASDLQNLLVGFFESANQILEDEELPGHYRLLRGTRERAAWLHEVLADRLTIDGTTAQDEADFDRRFLGTNQPDLRELVHLAQLRIRSDTLRDLASAARNPHSTERDLQVALERNLWIFGGQYLPTLAPRRIIRGNELDIPLLRPDGSVHVVELKRANVSILTHQRGNLILNGEVHRAIGQAMNYLLALDENRSQILDQHGIDVRRATASVLIGHSYFQPEILEAEMNDVLRTYNSHLARIEVLTYSQLLDGANRSLSLS